MRRLFFIGVIVFLMAMVGSANAATEFHLTRVNDHIYDGQIDIYVKYDGATITVKDLSPALNGISNVDIKAIGIVNPTSPVFNPVKTVVDNGAGSRWSIDTNNDKGFNRAGFGDFSTLCSKNNNVKTRGPIVLTLNSAFDSLPQNKDGNSIVVHISFGQEGEDLLVGSTWVAGSSNIPEFPTVVLPVAAILGLFLIMQHKRKEE
jgi:hypothetical protein